MAGKIHVAGPGQVDVSNSNTPGVIDPTNPVPGTDYRAVAQLSRNGKFAFTETNAYSGNNGRAAVEAKVGGRSYIYTAGNAGNGSNNAALLERASLVTFFSDCRGCAAECSIR